MPLPIINYHDPLQFYKSVSKVIRAVANDPIKALTDKHLYAAIGFFSLLPVLGHAAKGLYYALRAPSLNSIAQSYKPSTEGSESSWVVITGATNGIGKAFAETFAQLGFNLVVFGRDQDKLNSLESGLRALNSDIKIRKICVDFTQTYRKTDLEEHVLPHLNGLDISILINNVALGECYAFHDLPASKIFKIIHTNVYPQVYLTRLLISRLVARSKSHKTAIINISSNFGSEVFLPYFSVYSATKAFNDHFSKVLSVEYPTLDVLSARPGRTKTNMNPRGKVTADQQVRAILRSLGVKNETNGTFRSFLEANLGPSLYWLVKGSIRRSIRETYVQKYRAQLLNDADLPTVAIDV